MDETLQLKIHDLENIVENLQKGYEEMKEKCSKLEERDDTLSKEIGDVNTSAQVGIQGAHTACQKAKVSTIIWNIGAMIGCSGMGLWAVTAIIEAKLEVFKPKATEKTDTIKTKPTYWPASTTYVFRKRLR